MELPDDNEVIQAVYLMRLPTGLLKSYQVIELMQSSQMPAALVPRAASLCGVMTSTVKRALQIFTEVVDAGGISAAQGALGMTQSAVSHQLRVMRMAKLVKYRKEGRSACYSLDDDHVLKLYTQGLDHIGHATG